MGKGTLRRPGMRQITLHCFEAVYTGFDHVGVPPAEIDCSQKHFLLEYSYLETQPEWVEVQWRFYFPDEGWYEPTATLSVLPGTTPTIFNDNHRMTLQIADSDWTLSAYAIRPEDQRADWPSWAEIGTGYEVLKANGNGLGTYNAVGEPLVLSLLLFGFLALWRFAK
jgi:hypothetical protein